MEKDEPVEYMFKDIDLAPVIDLLQHHDISGWFHNNDGGPYLNEFQTMFADYCGTKHAYAISTGSASIYVALRACGIGRGDIVVVPAYTHIGTVAPVLLAGARPVFIDVDEYGNVDSEEYKRIPPYAKATIIVHQLGVPCEIDKIKENIEATVWDKMWIIEDASHALGAEYKGKKAGNLGDIGCFSIGGGRTKTIGCGEGGMITTNNEELALKCKNLRNHGDRITDVDYMCFNFRMSELNALVGLLQMNRINFLNDYQVKNAHYLMERLPSYLKPPKIPSYMKSTHYIVGCAFNEKLAGMTRDQFLSKVKEAGCEGGIPRKNVGAGYSKLICDIKYYKRFFNKPLPKSEAIRDNAIWVDWHRFPRTELEIRRLTSCLRRIHE